MYERINPAYPSAPYSPLPRFSKNVDKNRAPSATLNIASTSAGSRAASLELLNLYAPHALGYRTRWCMRSQPSGIVASFRRGWRMKAEAFPQQTGKTHRAGLILPAVAGDSDSRRGMTRRSDNSRRTAEFAPAREKPATRQSPLPIFQVRPSQHFASANRRRGAHRPSA